MSTLQRQPRTFASLVAAVATTMTVALGAGAATADPAPTGEAGSEVTVLSWPQLGMPSSVTLDTAAARDFTVPVPRGTRSLVLTGQVRSAQIAAVGRVDIEGADGTPVGQIAMPAPGPSETAVRFSADLSTLPVVDHAVTFRFVLRPRDSAEDRCAPAPGVTLFDLATRFGVDSPPPPQTVQGFLPPVLTTLTVQVPERPGPAEQQAVLDLATAVTARYRPAPVDIRVVASDTEVVAPPVAEDPLQRTVVVAEGGEPALSIRQNDQKRAYLAITGPAPMLAQQTALFATGIEAVAQASSATVTDPGTRTVHGSDTLTFDQLGASAQTQVLGRTDTYLGFEPTAFGSAQLGSARVHLLADYTPVHPEDSATLVVEAAGTVVQSLPLDDSGHVDRTFELPTQMPGRSTGMTMQLTYTPRGGCTPYTAPMSFRTDPRSTITVASGSGPRGGFAALPLAFMPNVQVAIDDSDPGNLARAATVLRSIQQLTATPLAVEVVSLEQAAGSGSGAVVVADTTKLDALGLEPPLAAGADGHVTVDAVSPRPGTGVGDRETADEVSPLSATVPGGVGSIQSFADHGRTMVLVTASGDWAPVDRLLTYAAGLDQGWASLAGDVLVAGADGEPSALTVRTDGTPRFLAETPTSWRRWAWLGAAAAFVAAVAVGVDQVRRRHATKRTLPRSDD